MADNDTGKPDGADGPAPEKVRDIDDVALQVFGLVQQAIIKHPIAAQAAFNALVTEGQHFAETHEGKRWKKRLMKSDAINRAQQYFELSTLMLLEKNPPGVLPSAYIDTLMMLASGEASEDMQDRLFSTGRTR